MVRRVATLILAALFLLSTICYSAVRVTIHPEVIITGPQITLGDIALIEGEDGSQIAALKRIPLGSAPQPGTRASLTRDLLTARLTASQTDFSGIEWGPVPEAISITTGGQVISGQVLAETILSKVQARLPAKQQEKFTVVLLQEIPDIVAPLGVISYELQNKNLRYGIPQTVYLVVSTDGAVFNRIPVKCEIRRFTSVVTAVTALSARDTLSIDNIRLSWLDVSQLPAGFLTKPDQADGLVILRSVSAGSVLYASYLDKPVLIKRGTPVVIAAAVGGAEATAPGIAQSNGREGQMITVRNTITGRLVTARVADKGRVEVLLYEQ